MQIWVYSPHLVGKARIIFGLMLQIEICNHRVETCLCDNSVSLYYFIFIFYH